MTQCSAASWLHAALMELSDTSSQSSSPESSDQFGTDLPPPLFPWGFLAVTERACAPTVLFMRVLVMETTVRRCCVVSELDSCQRTLYCWSRLEWLRRDGAGESPPPLLALSEVSLARPLSVVWVSADFPVLSADLTMLSMDWTLPSANFPPLSAGLTTLMRHSVLERSTSFASLLGTGLLRRDSEPDGLTAGFSWSAVSGWLYCCFTPHPGRTSEILSPCPNRPNEIGLLGRTNPRTLSHALSSSWSSPQACRQDTNSRVMLMYWWGESWSSGLP